MDENENPLKRTVLGIGTGLAVSVFSLMLGFGFHGVGIIPFGIAGVVGIAGLGVHIVARGVGTLLQKPQPPWDQAFGFYLGLLLSLWSGAQIFGIGRQR